jgi:TetR/AcrR family tetracycline transcriptional repressor
VYAFGLGAAEPHRRLVADIRSSGASRSDAEVAATVVLQFVLGFTFSEQQHLQADSAGAIPGVTPPPDPARAVEGSGPFTAGVTLILDGIDARLPDRLWST